MAPLSLALSPSVPAMLLLRLLHQGNLLRGIDNCLGVQYKELGVPWKPSFSNNVSLFLVENQIKKKCLPHMVAIKKIFFWKKIYKKTAISNHFFLIKSV